MKMIEKYIPNGETKVEYLERNNGFNPTMTLKHRCYGYTPPKRDVVETKKICKGE